MLLFAAGNQHPMRLPRPEADPGQQALRAPQSHLNMERYVSAFLTDTCPDLQSETARHFRSAVPHTPGGVVYVYCLKSRRMLYVHGLMDLLGFPDEQGSLQFLTALTSARFAAFMHEISRKVFHFFLDGVPSNSQYSLRIEQTKYHRSGHEVPVVSQLSIYELEGNQVSKVIGRILPATATSKSTVVRYSTGMDLHNPLEEYLSKSSWHTPAISARERDALQYLSGNIARQTTNTDWRLQHDKAREIERLLCRRFGMGNLMQLLAFARKEELLF